MRIFLFSLLLLLCSGLFAQNQEAVFPDAWFGEWAGELSIYSAAGVAQSLEMELHISPGEEGKWGWTIMYKGDETDVREYELQLKDAAKAHYIIDEKNSILLDGYFLGNTLINRFSVNSNLIMINYTFESGHIVFDVFSGERDNTQLTGEEIKDFEIHSYQMGTRQRAILFKKKKGREMID